MATLPRSFVPDNPVVPKSFVPDEPVSAVDEDIAPDTTERDFGPNHVARNGKGQQVYFDGTIWKDAFTGKQAEGPQQQAATIPGMEKLGALPGVPGPAVNMQYSPYGRTPAGVPMGPVDTTFDTAPALEKIARGGKQILTAGPTPTRPANVKQLLSGGSDVIEGAMTVGAPLVIGGLATAPLATVGTMAASSLAGGGTEAGSKALGASPELSRFLGNAVSLAAVGGGIKYILGKGDAAIARHNEVARTLLEQERSRGNVSDQINEIFRGESHPIVIDGKPARVEYAGGTAWQVVNEQGKPIFGGKGRDVTEWLQSKGAKAADIAPEPTPIVRTAEAPKPPESFVPDESPIQGGPLTRVRKVRMPKSFVPDTPPEAVAPPESRVAPIETPTSGQEVQPVVAPPAEQSAPAENTPALAAAPPSGGLPETVERGPGWVGNIPTSEINVDAPRFQFKANVGQGGAGEELREVTKFDPEKAGVTAVWKDPADGKTYVVNGHHRVELAQRTQYPEMTVRYLNAKDAREARLKGALINIAEGRGESTDAAKVFRDSGATPEALKAEGVSLKGKVASEGLALSRLSTPIFNDVISGDLSPARGAVIGQGVPEHADQEALYDLIKSREKGGKRLTNDQIGELIRLTNEAPRQTETQDSLFGAEEMTRSLLPEKAEVSDYIRKQLATERKLFGTVSTQAAAEKLGEAGNVIKAGENAQQAERANQGVLLYDKLSAKAGPIASALDRAARSIAEGESAHEVKQRTYREVRNELGAQVRALSGNVDVRRTEGLGDEGPLQTRRGERNQESLVPPDEEQTIRRQGEQYRDKLTGERLTAQFKSGMAFKPAKLKPARSASLFEDSPAEQGALFNKPIEGPAFRPGMSRSAKVTESQVIPARAGREKYPVLHVNAQAMNVLHEAAGMEDGHEIPGVTFTTPQAEELMRTINTELRKARLRNKPAEIAKWEEIRSAIEQNRAQAKGRPLIAVQNGTDITPEEYATALQEELDHASQLEATGDIYAHHLGPEGTKSFLGTAEGSKAANALRRTYPDVSDSQAVMEIGVRLMRPGRFAELGLSPEEARNLRDAYVNALISRHGVERTVRISQKISAAKDREGRVNYGHAGKTTLDARRSGGSERTEAPAPREDGGGSGVRKGGGGGGEGLPPVRSDEGPLQQRKDQGPEFRKKPSALRVATDFFKPVETRIAQEGPAGKQLKRHLVRAEDVGEVQAGKRVVALRDSGLQDLSREDRQNLVDSLQGFAQPQNAAVQKAFDGIRKVTDEIAAEATAAGVQSKQARTIRPEDPIPPTAKLTQAQKDLRAAGKRIFVQYKRPFQARTNFYPHVIPPPDELRSGDIRRDVADNMVRNGVAANGDEARQMIDEYRKFIDTGERSKKLEAHLVESGQARDENEAHTLLGILRRRVIKRQGSLEYSRQVDLPFYDPDPARVMPKFVTATSLRLAQIREFGQNDEVVNRLIRIIDQTTGNPGFAKMAVDKILAKVNEADTGTARISRAVRAFNGFKLGLSFIPNATQGALNSFLKSDLPSTLAGAKGLMTKEGRRFAMQSGASLEGVVNEMLRSVGADNSALGTFLKGTGFAQTEQANRIWAANAGYAYAKRMLARLQKNPQDGRARKILTELGLKPDVLLRLGKIDGDAALIAAKKFSDITQFRGGIKDLPYFAASPLGKVIFQFKSFVYGQTRLVYDETVQELKEGRPGRAFRTLLLLATVFPLAGEVISDLRTWMKGGERKTSGIKRWLEDIGQAGSLGVIYDMLDAGGWGKGVEFFAGPTLGEAGQVVNIAGGDKKARNAAKWIVKHVPFLGPLFYSRIFPPKEAQSPALKKLTGGSKLRRPKLRTKL